MTKLSSSLPAGDGNGLDAIARQLIDSPSTLHVAIALVDCKRTMTDTDTGEIVPTARVRRIEIVGSTDIDVAQQIMRRALEERTGQTVLPLDLEDELRAAFGDIDPATGELLSRDDD
jgi:hypothetical protein